MKLEFYFVNVWTDIDEVGTPLLGRKAELNANVISTSRSVHH